MKTYGSAIIDCFMPPKIFTEYFPLTGSQIVFFGMGKLRCLLVIRYLVRFLQIKNTFNTFMIDSAKLSNFCNKVKLQIPSQ